MNENSHNKKLIIIIIKITIVNLITVAIPPRNGILLTIFVTFYNVLLYIVDTILSFFYV